MASIALLRRRRIVYDYFNISSRSIQTFHILVNGQLAEHETARGFSSVASNLSRGSDSAKGQQDTVVSDEKLLPFTTLGLFHRSAYGISAFGNGGGKQGFVSPMNVQLMLHPVRFASTAIAKPPDPGSDDEDNEELVAKKRKEASPEECDQAVVGLSLVKAKAKAKRQLEASQRVAKSALQRIWATMLGIGPALKAVASMSREDWAKKLVHWKNEVKSTLQHYWLGFKLLWADVRISSRLMLKLAGGKSLSRRERQKLTRTTADIFRLVPFAVFIIVPFMEFLLPVFLKLFPNMLPSTFQDKMKEQEALKQRLNAAQCKHRICKVSSRHCQGDGKGSAKLTKWRH